MSDERVEYFYKPIPISERTPDLPHYINDRLILLDDYYDVLKVVPVGIMTEWEAIKGRAEYWLEKTDAPSIQDKDAEIEKLKGLLDNLLNAIPKQDNDHDWWEDGLTQAYDEANAYLENNL